MSRVLIIDPPLYKHPLWDPVRYAQPLGPWSIASHLQAHGHEVKLLCAPPEDWENQQLVLPPTSSPARLAGPQADPMPAAFHLRRKALALARGDSPESILQRFSQRYCGAHLQIGLTPADIASAAAAFGPDLIGISLVASCYHRSALDVASALREQGYDGPIVVGGQHATALPEQVLRDANDSIDWLVRGEGEQIMLAIAKAPHQRERIAKLPGVCYLNEDGVFRKNPRPCFFDLSEIALPRAEILAAIPMPEVPPHTFDTQGRRYTDAMFSVGCHNSCSYCYSPQMRGRVRHLPEASIQRLLEDLWAHGFRELVLQDDDLLHDRPAFLRLIRLIHEIGFVWQDNGGIELEQLDEALVDEIAASGCSALYVPVNPRRIADRLPSPEALMNIRVLRRLKDHGIYTYTSGIYGVPNLSAPEKTLDDLRALRDFHLELVDQGYVDASLVFPLAALPGTKWFYELRRHQEFSVDTADWLSYSIYVPQVRPRAVPRLQFDAELLEVHRSLNQIQRSLPWFSPFPNTPFRTHQPAQPPQEVAFA